MDKFKTMLIGVSALFLVYLVISAPAMMEKYAPSSDSQNYLLLNGKKYTESDLKENGEYQKARKNYVESLGQVFQNFGLQEVIQLEAKSQNLSKDELMKKNISPPTDSEIATIYEQYKDQLRGASLEEARPQIIEFLMQMKEGQFRQSLLDKYKLEVHTEKPPRMVVDEKNNPSLGPKDAKITIIEFSDFECPYCSRSQEVNKAIREKYEGKVRWVFRDYPLPFHKKAMFAHIAANCAHKQDKYWSVFEKMFQNTGTLTEEKVIDIITSEGIYNEKFQECVKDPAIAGEIQKDIEDGQSLGVNGTPAFFINGIMVEGARPLSAFESIIEKELK